MASVRDAGMSWVSSFRSRKQRCCGQRFQDAQNGKRSSFEELMGALMTKPPIGEVEEVLGESLECSDKAETIHSNIGGM